MYIPKAFHVDDRAELVAFMRAHNFATLVTSGQAGMAAATVPLTIHDDGATLRAVGHLAKANPQSKELDATEGLILFQGPHAYVSPAWYQAHESVPTWNYMAVHVYGRLRAIHFDDSPAEIDTLLAGLIAQHEPAYQTQWDALPDRFRDGMRRGIVGFELIVDRLEGKYKLSQNRSIADQATVAAALSASLDADEQATGAAMRQLQEKQP